MKKVLIILSLIIVLAGAYRFIQTTFSTIGTGETCESPDKKYLATAYEWSSESFWGERRYWFEFKVEDTQFGQVIQRLETDPIDGPCFGSRSSHRVVYWNDDSTEVIFTFPSVDIKMRVDPGEDSGYQEAQGDAGDLSLLFCSLSSG